MIQTKEDLKFYLSKDRKALKIKSSTTSLFGKEIWKYLILLRYLEYYNNKVHKSKLDRIKLAFFFWAHHYFSIYTGFSIPPNTVGYGLRLSHLGPIIINPKARLGNYCDIHVGVNIGQNMTEEDVPTIGNNVWIGPGVKIYGKIKIGDKIMIGANSVVGNSFNEENITIAGIPAKKIKDTGNPFIFDYDS